ncbi:hypothetical protein [Sphingobacterium cellulitidis]|nr:hypothetical protein [Sphingobacterium soli]
MNRVCGRKWWVMIGWRTLKRTNNDEKIRIESDNIKYLSKIDKPFGDGKVKFDAHGRLGYLHGSPVCDMIFVRNDISDNIIYREIAEEWFDPESQKARDFKWPEESSLKN